MTPELLALLEKIREVAAKKSIYDSGEYVDLSDYHGGNYDDAYYKGTEEGEISFARELLAYIEE
jgi:hypothetical protein